MIDDPYTLLYATKLPYLKRKILVIENDIYIAQAMIGQLETGGFETTLVANASMGMRELYQNRAELVILEDSLSHVDKTDICSHIGLEAGLPVIMLGEQQDDTSVVTAIERGAGFYMKKPISVMELVARVRALLRRSRHPRGPLDAAAQAITLDGQTIQLTPTEFRLLSYLMAHPNRIVSPDELLSLIWGGGEVTRDCVKLYIHQLRQKLDQYIPTAIQSRRGCGYYFNQLS